MDAQKSRILQHSVPHHYRPTTSRSPEAFLRNKSPT